MKHCYLEWCEFVWPWSLRGKPVMPSSSSSLLGWLNYQITLAQNWSLGETSDLKSIKEEATVGATTMPEKDGDWRDHTRAPKVVEFWEVFWRGGGGGGGWHVHSKSQGSSLARKEECPCHLLHKVLGNSIYSPWCQKQSGKLQNRNKETSCKRRASPNIRHPRGPNKPVTNAHQRNKYPYLPLPVNLLLVKGPNILLPTCIKTSINTKIAVKKRSHVL